jgi:regulator of cell morphogenesis and NO signaling
MAITFRRLPGLLFLLGDELDRHMRRKEVAIFPAIEALEKSPEEREDGATPAQSHIADLVSDTLWEHDDIAARLAEVRWITRDYELPSYAGTSYCAPFRRLEALERSLSEHDVRSVKTEDFMKSSITISMTWQFFDPFYQEWIRTR